VTLEGGFIIAGFAIFSLGVVFLLTSGFLMNGDNLPSSTPHAKVLAKCSSCVLRAGSGVLLAGMVAYTVKHVKDKDQKEMLDDTLKYVGQLLMRAMINDNEVTTYESTDMDMAAELLSLQFHFGWCFVFGWVGGVVSLVAGVMGWAISDKVGKVTRYDFEMVASK